MVQASRSLAAIGDGIDGLPNGDAAVLDALVHCAQGDQPV
jgi:hypothetical protein